MQCWVSLQQLSVCKRDISFTEKSEKARYLGVVPTMLLHIIGAAT